MLDSTLKPRRLTNVPYISSQFLSMRYHNKDSLRSVRDIMNTALSQSGRCFREGFDETIKFVFSE